MNYTKILNKIAYGSNNLFINTRTYALKSDLKIKWIRPEKIECFKPQKSGDLKPMPDIDKKQLRIGYRDSKELVTANDLVKRLFSLEFAPRKETVELYKNCIQKTVCNHEFDDKSIEVRIARWTGQIRSMQQLMEEYPRNKLVKVHLKELIEKRKKHLKFLRRQDYKKFEWLLENLDIVFKPSPTVYEPVTRKGSLRKLTDKYCEDIKNERLNQYKLQLQEEQPAFLEEKIRMLEFIRQEQRDCSVEVTVKQEEIDEARRQLEDLKANKLVED